MTLGRRLSCPWTRAMALALLAAVSGCQSKASVSEALDPAAIAAPGAPAGSGVAAAPQAVMATQSLGTGPAKITMLLPLSAPGSAGEDGRKMLDAAKLAMADLGNNLLTLTVEDTRGDPGQARRIKALRAQLFDG